MVCIETQSQALKVEFEQKLAFTFQAKHNSFQREFLVMGKGQKNSL